MNNTSTINYLRSFRVINYAVFDFIASFIGMFILAKIFKWNMKKTMLLTIPLSVVSHILVDNITPLTKQTIGEGNYLVKIIMIILVISAFMVE